MENITWDMFSLHSVRPFEMANTLGGFALCRISTVFFFIPIRSFFSLRCSFSFEKCCFLFVICVASTLPSGTRKMCEFTSSCTCGKSYPGIRAVLKQCLVSNDSVFGQ